MNRMEDRGERAWASELAESQNQLRFLYGLSATQSQLVDRWILSLSSGAFGISLVILSNFSTKDLFWLYASWICFCASILAVLVSFHTSSKALEEEMKRIEHFIKRRKDYSPKKKWDWATKSLHALSQAAFLVGMFALAAFMIGALDGEEPIETALRLKDVFANSIPE